MEEGDGTNEPHMLHLFQYSMHTTNVCERKKKPVNQVRHDTLKHLHVLGRFTALLVFEYLLAVVLSFS